jgi:hypothetical protein
MRSSSLKMVAFLRDLALQAVITVTNLLAVDHIATEAVDHMGLAG